MKRRRPLRRGGRLRRRTPLRRRGWIRPRRVRSRRSPRRLNPTYVALVRLQPCRLRDMPGHRCEGPLDPHHAGRKYGAKLKADDDTTIPLCRLGHRQLEGASGPFRDTTAEHRRWWQDVQIRLMQLVARHEFSRMTRGLIRAVGAEPEEPCS